MGNKHIWERSSNRSNRAGAKIGKKDPGEKFGGEDEYNERPVYRNRRKTPGFNYGECQETVNGVKKVYKKAATNDFFRLALGKRKVG